ncbi:MAG: RsiW-degrading membrane proteinase PrsW (M82 family) [Rhodothermales bacterium]|jgi:RsiW-degrading membrane proteinase PrsW (M82 family)
MALSILISSWSAILIFALLVRSKYRWTRPPYQTFIVFAAAGVLSTLPAIAVNSFLGENTALWFLSPDPLKSGLGFMIGAGFGEELCKMLSGIAVLILIFQPRALYASVTALVTLLALAAWHYLGWEPSIDSPLALLPIIAMIAFVSVLVRPTLSDADCVLGFVIVGLAFAVVENLYSYSDLPVHHLLVRGLMAVPLHAAMGMVQGVAVRSARRRKAAWPLFFGYLFAVACHTGWDLAASLPGQLQEWVLVPGCVLMILVCVRVWKLVPEVEVDDLAYQHAA